MSRRITLDCRFSRWETAQTVYTRYLEPGEKGEEAAEGCSRRGASARTGGIYNKKKNINGKREANEKNEKDVWRPQRRLEGRRKMRTILLAPLQPRRKWGERRVHVMHHARRPVHPAHPDAPCAKGDGERGFWGSRGEEGGRGDRV